jgi:hypothetical protein
MAEQAFPEISAAITAALAEIAADPDPVHAYAMATALGLIGRELLDTARCARGVALGRLRVDQELTLAEVADVVRMSKSRASQLISGRAAG